MSLPDFLLTHATQAQTVITTDGHLESLTKVTAELKSLAEKNNEAISRLLAVCSTCPAFHVV